MNVFDTHAKIISDYASYIRSFINIADPAIRQTVDVALAEGKLWPQPLLQFNPSYAMAGSVTEIASTGVLHGAVTDIFKGYTLYRHQVEAIKLGTAGQDFVVTSGTGSGKSLTYIASIFHRLLGEPQSKGVTAVVVYPMNALINSQTNEFKTYKENYEKSTGQDFPITFGQYTGQEKEEARKAMRENPPQVLLTNYMMLELLLTRVQERSIRDAIYENLRFLVFDELHTYRGRQGADVAMLIRRILAQCKRHTTCIGTSATMVSVGSLASQREQVAQVATTVFGRQFRPNQVVNETLTRSLAFSGTLPNRQSLAQGITAGIDTNSDEASLRSHPVFVPTGSTSGEFISRPRAIALREFGPLNVIYHNGRKYRVSQLVVQDAESSLTEAKISAKAGYYLIGDQKDLEICPFSGANLGDNANKEHIHDLLEMAESRAEEVDRISCEEEERVSRGFNVQTYFAVDGGHLDRVRKAIARSSETNLLNLRYIPAARLVHVNTQWRAQKTEGFPIGLTSGDWRSSMPEPKDNPREDFRLVKLWTSNLADALYIEPIQPLGLAPEGVITLQHALKRAIEQVFQVEPSEIGVVTVGDPETPNILLYEAAEGSLGILSQFVEDVQTFRKVVEAAKVICRFDDPQYLAPASYDDLLSYYNQRDHKVIDRFLIRDALDKLALCVIEIQTNTGFRDYEEQYQSMLRNLDPNSSTERAFIQYLHDNGLRLPDAAQKRVDGVYCQPDFYYEPRFWVFCDGSPHDDNTVRERDESQRQAIIARGDEVWSWHYRQDLAARIAQRPDVFRKVR